MYANPSEETSEYVVVTDAAGTPLPIQKITGETSAKVKKKYVAMRNDLASKAGIKEAATAPPEVCEAAWQQVSEMLHRLAAKRKQQKGKKGQADEVPDLPDEIHLKLGVIYQEANGFREEEIELGKAAKSKTASPATP
jgi:hypothetical protein